MDTTPKSVLSDLPTLGLETNFQADPFQCSVSDCATAFPSHPTAQTSVADEPEIALSSLPLAPGFGLLTRVGGTSGRGVVVGGGALVADVGVAPEVTLGDGVPCMGDAVPDGVASKALVAVG